MSQNADGTDHESVSRFLRELQSLAESGEKRQAMVAVFSRIDDLANSGRFSECETLLMIADPESIDTEVGLSLLIASGYIPRSFVPSRARFFGNLRNRFVNEFGEERASRVFDCLRSPG